MPSIVNASTITTDDDFLDLYLPLMPQLLGKKWTKAYYLTQVHRPRHLPKPATLFPWKILEMLTRTPWWIVPLVWLPVVLYLVSCSPSGGPVFTGLFLFGLASWTLIEYCFHRFFFHIDAALPDHQWAFIVHFLVHGFHHFLPMDRYRLVMPPVLFATLYLPVLCFTRLIFPQWYLPMNAGGVLGYVSYDLFHYFFHHARMQGDSFVATHVRQMKKLHLAHHYSSHAESYGVTSDIWDHVFGTVNTTAIK